RSRSAASCVPGECLAKSRCLLTSLCKCSGIIRRIVSPACLRCSAVARAGSSSITSTPGRTVVGESPTLVCHRWPTLCAGSVDTTSVEACEESSNAVAFAIVVFPTPPLPPKNMTGEVGTFNNTEYSPTVNSPFPSGGARRGHLHTLQEEARWYRSSLGLDSRALLTSPTA